MNSFLLALGLITVITVAVAAVCIAYAPRGISAKIKKYKSGGFEYRISSTRGRLRKRKIKHVKPIADARY